MTVHGQSGRAARRGAPRPEQDADLLELARRLRALAGDRPDLMSRADRLLERAALGRFHIAVIGDFKRGKSTLVNALIGRSVLPSGVVPVTAVATEVHFGATSTVVVFSDGRHHPVSEAEIVAYVSERENPANAKQVDRVEVGIPQVFGAPGVVLVDTPGAGSANAHNSEAASAALADADAAVLVVSADSPVSESEEAFLAELGRRRCPVFVAVNKIDRLREPELDEVEAYVTSRLRANLVAWEGPFCTDARSALEGAGERWCGARGFGALRAALQRFVVTDLAEARRQATIGDIARLAQRLQQAVELESAAAALDAAALESRLARFRCALEEGRLAYGADRVVLAHAASDLVERATATLSAEADAAARAAAPSLGDLASQFPARSVEIELRHAVERIVRTGFEPLRLRAEEELGAQWAAAAQRFIGQVHDRIAGVVGAAQHLFDVHLPAVPVPAVAALPPGFSYQFLTVDSPTSSVGRALGAWVLPGGLVRHRAVAGARRRVVDEFAKHAGRARYDMSQRLEVAKAGLVAAMTLEIDQTERSLLGAVERARTLLAEGADARSRQERLRSEVRSLVEVVARR